jgi:hypothetical protein
MDPLLASVVVGAVRVIPALISSYLLFKFSKKSVFVICSWVSVIGMVTGTFLLLSKAQDTKTFFNGVVSFTRAYGRLLEKGRWKPFARLPSGSRKGKTVKL